MCIYKYCVHVCHKFSHAAREENREIELWPIDVHFCASLVRHCSFAGGCVTAWPADRLHSRARSSSPVAPCRRSSPGRLRAVIASFVRHYTPVLRNTTTITRAIRKDFTPPGDGLVDDYNRNRSRGRFSLARPWECL